MSKTAHIIFISILAIIVVLAFLALSYLGYGYYQTILEERFFHSGHANLKPSGALGHGLGIIGSFLMIIGVSSYMARKRYRFLSRLGLLKHWLEFHIFLCTLGPILVLFHTSFKFGGIVAISFWSMVAVFLSGIIGRFIYIQIPRTIEGREMSRGEIRNLKSEIGQTIKNSLGLDEESYNQVIKSIESSNSVRPVKSILKTTNISHANTKKVLRLVKKEITLNKRISRLNTMQNLFKYWHVAHLPFALVMLVIMVIHVVVTIVFGYRWIF